MQFSYRDIVLGKRDVSVNSYPYFRASVARSLKILETIPAGNQRASMGSVIADLISFESIKKSPMVTVQGAEVTMQGAEVTMQGAEVTMQGAEVIMQGAEVAEQGPEVTLQGVSLDIHKPTLSPQPSPSPNQPSTRSPSPNHRLALDEVFIASAQTQIPIP